MAKLDQEVIDLFKAGDMEAFKIIYNQTKQLVFSVTYKMTGNLQDAEDLTHDIYLQAFEKRSGFDQSKSAITTWLYQIAVNYSLNYEKRKKWLLFDIDFDQVFTNKNEPDILSDTIKIEKYADLNKALSKIKPDYKICLVLKEMEDKSYQEISELLEINIGTVRSRINRAKKELKKYYIRGDNYEK